MVDGQKKGPKGTVAVRVIRGLKSLSGQSVSLGKELNHNYIRMSTYSKGP